MPSKVTRQREAWQREELEQERRAALAAAQRAREAREKPAPAPIITHAAAARPAAVVRQPPAPLVDARGRKLTEAERREYDGTRAANDAYAARDAARVAAAQQREMLRP